MRLAVLVHTLDTTQLLHSAEKTEVKCGGIFNSLERVTVRLVHILHFKNEKKKGFLPVRRQKTARMVKNGDKKREDILAMLFFSVLEISQDDEFKALVAH